MPSTEIQMLLGEIGSELLLTNHTLDQVADEQRLGNDILAEQHSVQTAQQASLEAIPVALAAQQSTLEAIPAALFALAAQQQAALQWQRQQQFALDTQQQAERDQAIVHSPPLPMRDAAGQFVSPDPPTASPPPDMVAEGRLAAQQSEAARASGGLQGAQRALDDFRQGLDLVPSQFRAIATASRTTATVIKAALISTGVGAFIVLMGALLGAVTALIGGVVKLGADFKRVDADIQSTGLSLLEIERSARYASFAFADLDDARAVTMRLADSAQEAQYQLQNFGQIDTQQIIAATRLGVGYFEAIRSGQRGLDAVAEQLRSVGGDIDVRLIRDAFKVSLEDAEYIRILATGTDAQIAEAEKQREQARVIGDAEREAAKTQHTTIQNMGADIRNRLIPAVEKLVEISGNILGAAEAAARFFGYDTPAAAAAREEEARLNVQRVLLESIGGLDTDPVRQGSRFIGPPAPDAVAMEAQRLQRQEIGFTDTLRAGFLNDFSGIADSIEARIQPTTATGELPWYHRPAREVAGEIGSAIADELRSLPLPWETRPVPPATINNTYNITGGMRELEDTRRVSDEANMRVVRGLTP